LVKSEPEKIEKQHSKARELGDFGENEDSAQNYLPVRLPFFKEEE